MTSMLLSEHWAKAFIRSRTLSSMKLLFSCGLIVRQIQPT